VLQNGAQDRTTRELAGEKAENGLGVGDVSRSLDDDPNPIPKTHNVTELEGYLRNPFSVDEDTIPAL
jgi:hypothetical protein